MFGLTVNFKSWLLSKYRYKLIFIVCSLFFLSNASFANSEMFPSSYEHKGITFTKCSASKIRAMKFFNVGNAALYLENCLPFETPLNKNILFTIKYSMDIDANDFKTSSLELLRRNTTENLFSEIVDAAKQFNQSYQNVKKGDQYYVIFTQEHGLDLLLNKKLIGNSQNASLAKHYFSIWFGTNPFNKPLKKNLLSPLILD